MEGPEFYDNLDLYFDNNPTDDTFVQTLTAGIADGTIPLSESEFEESEDDG